MGNSDEFFIGPEIPGKGATGQDGSVGSTVPLYKDGAGKIKRQAARFYIWKYVWNDALKKYLPKEEINADSPNIKEIKWRAELANRKASFFAFHGTNGETSPYSAGYSFVEQRRNHLTPGLEIVPGERSIKKGEPPKEFRKSGLPVQYLGELRADDKGRLLVLGGHGTSMSSTSPPAPLPTYANNDNWFDDISDGPVRASITFQNGTSVPSDQIVDAWVLVGPPDFAPEIGNLVTLWDTLCDVAVQYVPFSPEDGLFDEYAPGKGLARLKQMKADFSVPAGFGTYKVSFSKEIYPLVQRVLNYSFVHKYAAGHHVGFPWDKLAEPNDAAFPERKQVKDMFLGWIREPLRVARPSDPSLMSSPYMPKLLGDEAEEDPGRGVPSGNPREFLKLSDLQYAQLLQWWKGNFEKDGWLGSPPSLSAPPPDVTPEGLDRAAAESCVGGAFYPGIEVSWLIRNPKVYSEFWGPFRIDPWQRDAGTGAIKKDGGGNFLPKEIDYGTKTIKMQAGFFSQQMALPWQADFMDCAVETHGGLGGAPTPFGWWPAQRPDNVPVPSTGAPGAPWRNKWARGLGSHEDMIANWATLGFVESSPAGGFLEKEGPPPYEPKPLSIDSALPVANLLVNEPVSAKLTASGGVPPYVWSQDPASSASWPSWLTLLPSGDLSGTTPSAAGKFTFSVQVADSDGGTDTKSFEINVKDDSWCFIATAAYGSPLAPQVQFLREIRDEVLRQTEWGFNFFETYWKYYYRISPPIAEEMKRDPQLRRTIRWSIVEPWSNYMRLLVSQPDWNRVDIEGLDPAVRDFITQLRSDMDRWLGAIELRQGFTQISPQVAVKELNAILNFIKRTGGLEYLDQLVERGGLPLRYEPEQEAELLGLLRQGGRRPEEIHRILKGGGK